MKTLKKISMPKSAMKQEIIEDMETKISIVWVIKIELLRQTVFVYNFKVIGMVGFNRIC